MLHVHSPLSLFSWSCLWKKGMDHQNMEETAAAAPQPTSTESTTPTQPEALESSRRRVGGLKRKNNSSSSSTPSKRLAKDRAPLPPLYNGPSVKTRQSPNKMAAAHLRAVPSDPSALPPPKRDNPPIVSITSAAQPQMGSADLRVEDEGVDEGAAAVEKMELSEEVLKDENAHIVPNSVGWFSWTRIHTMEKRGLTSFFDGNSNSRNPDMYLEIRNAIMKRYHKNPHKQIGVADFSDIVSEDTEAVREIMEFLDHWGLINFRPFLNFQQFDSIAEDNVNSSTVNGEHETDAISASVLDKLYRFEKVDSCSRRKRSAATASMSLPTPVLADTTVPEVLVGPRGPAVEYHCNSCQADCSAKRYHCQKQADFDLCSDCFNAEKFGTGMASTDFILMEPMTEKGVHGGSWTDQETLLLLEALELYGDNWNEIAEHVATKTKAQCILHFIRLPIEDPFLEHNDMPDVTIQSNMETVSANKELTTAAQSTSESPDAKCSTSEEQPGISKNDDIKSKQVDEGQPSQEKAENDATKAIMSAFQAVGALSGSEESLSFAEAGNPVMALVAFLAAMVGPEVATASAQSALKAMHDNAPAMQLAAKHCFVLENPPNDSRDDNANSRTGARKLENQSLSVEQSKNSEENPSEKVDGPVTSEAPKEAETVEASTSIEESQAGHGNSNSVMTNGENTGKVDPEQTCTASDEKDDKVDIEQTCSTTEKKFPEDSVDIEESRSTDKMKHTNENCPEDSIKVEDSHSSDRMTSTNEEKCAEDSGEADYSHHLAKLKRAAITVLSGVSVKAKLLAEQEEERIQQLVGEVINIQLNKLDMKLRHFRELDFALLKAREQVEREKQRLLMEHAHILAGRFGFPSGQPRSISLPSAFGNPPAVAVGRFLQGGSSRLFPNMNIGIGRQPVFPYPGAHIRNAIPPLVPSSSARILSSVPGSTSHTVDPQETTPQQGENLGSEFN